MITIFHLFHNSTNSKNRHYLYYYMDLLCFGSSLLILRIFKITDLMEGSQEIKTLKLQKSRYLIEWKLNKFIGKKPHFIKYEYIYHIINYIFKFNMLLQYQFKQYSYTVIILIHMFMQTIHTPVGNLKITKQPSAPRFYFHYHLLYLYSLTISNHLHSFIIYLLYEHATGPTPPSSYAIIGPTPSPVIFSNPP